MNKLLLIIAMLIPTISRSQQSVRVFGDSTNTPIGNVGDALKVTIPGGITVTTSSGTPTVSISSITVVALNITTAGGTGNAVFDSTGTLSGCSILAPASSNFDFEIVTNDADNHPEFGASKKIVTQRTSLVGERTIAGSHKANVENATVDGTYKVRCMVKQ